MNPNNEQARNLAEQALADSPQYVDHISALFDRCSQRIRSGNQRDAMIDLARAADDLHQFSMLIDMVSQSVAPHAKSADTFRSDLESCLGELEHALVAEDMAAVSNYIDQDLLPIFPRWSDVANDLHAAMGQ